MNKVAEKSVTSANIHHDIDKIKVLLVEDYVLLRHIFRNILEEEDDIIVVADTGEHKEVPKLVSKMRPDVIIIDISSRDLGKLKTIQEVKEVCPNTKILLIISPDDYDVTFGALMAGATGCLTKSTSGSQLVRAVRAIVADHIVLSRSVGEELLKHATWHPVITVSRDAGERLSLHELDIIKLIAFGMRNREIGKTLGLSPHTVKKYLADIYTKLAVHTRTEAVIIGLQAGFLSLDDLGYRRTE